MVAVLLLEAGTPFPDTYPLSLNALASGCIQKTARSPVMVACPEDEILTAIDGLKSLSLVFGQQRPGAALEQNMAKVAWRAEPVGGAGPTLLLRGPQTAAGATPQHARLHAFADISSVEGVLDELAEQSGPRYPPAARPGERESRWMHLLCGRGQRGRPGGAARASAPEGGSSSELRRCASASASWPIGGAAAGPVEEMAGQLGMTVEPGRLG